MVNLINCYHGALEAAPQQCKSELQAQQVKRLFRWRKGRPVAVDDKAPLQE